MRRTTAAGTLCTFSCVGSTTSGGTREAKEATCGVPYLQIRANTCSPSSASQSSAIQQDVNFYLSMMKRDSPAARRRNSAFGHLVTRTSEVIPNDPADPTQSSSVSPANNNNITTSTSPLQPQKARLVGAAFEKNRLGHTHSKNKVDDVLTKTALCSKCKMVNEVQTGSKSVCFACGTIVDVTVGLTGAPIQTPTLPSTATMRTMTGPQSSPRSGSPTGSPRGLVASRQREIAEVRGNEGARRMALHGDRRAVVNCAACGLLNEGTTGDKCFACGMTLKGVDMAKETAGLPKSGGMTVNANRQPQMNVDQQPATSLRRRLEGEPPTSKKSTCRNVQRCSKCGMVNEDAFAADSCFACGTSLAHGEAQRAASLPPTAWNPSSVDPVAAAPPRSSNAFDADESEVGEPAIGEGDEVKLAASGGEPRGLSVPCGGCGLQNEADSSECFACGMALPRLGPDIHPSTTSNPHLSQDTSDARRHGDAQRAQGAPIEGIVPRTDNWRKDNNNSHRKNPTNKMEGPSLDPRYKFETAVAAVGGTPTKGHTRVVNAVTSIHDIGREENLLSQLPTPPPSCPMFHGTRYQAIRVMQQIKSAGLLEFRGRLGEEDEYESWVFGKTRVFGSPTSREYRPPSLSVARSLLETSPPPTPILAVSHHHEGGNEKSHSSGGGTTPSEFIYCGGVLSDSPPRLINSDPQETQPTLIPPTSHGFGNNTAAHWSWVDGGAASSAEWGGVWATSSYDNDAMMNTDHQQAASPHLGFGAQSAASNGEASPWGASLTDRLQQPGGLLQKYQPSPTHRNGATMNHHHVAAAATVITAQDDVPHTLQHAISVPASTLSRWWGWTNTPSSATATGHVGTGSLGLGGNEPRVVIGRIVTVEHLKPLQVLHRALLSGRLELAELHFHILDRAAFVRRYRVEKVLGNVLPYQQPPLPSLETTHDDIPVITTHQLQEESVLSGKIGDYQLGAAVIGAIELQDDAQARWLWAVEKACRSDADAAVVQLDKLLRLSVPIGNVPHRLPWRLHTGSILACPFDIPIAAKSDMSTILRNVAAESCAPTQWGTHLASSRGRGGPTLGTLFGSYLKKCAEVFASEYEIRASQREQQQFSAATDDFDDDCSVVNSEWSMAGGVSASSLRGTSPAVETPSDRCVNCLLRRDVFSSSHPSTTMDVCELCGQNQFEPPLYAVRSRRLQSAEQRHNEDIDQRRHNQLYFQQRYQPTQPTQFGGGGFSSGSSEGDYVNAPSDGAAARSWGGGGNVWLDHFGLPYRHAPVEAARNPTLDYNYDHYGEWKKRQDEDDKAAFIPRPLGGLAEEAANSTTTSTDDEWAAIDQSNQSNSGDVWGHPPSTMATANHNDWDGSNQYHQHPQAPPYSNEYRTHEAAPHNATIAPSVIAYAGGRRHSGISTAIVHNSTNQRSLQQQQGSGASSSDAFRIPAPGTPTVARTKLGLALGSALGSSGPTDILPPVVEW